MNPTLTLPDYAVEAMVLALPHTTADDLAKMRPEIREQMLREMRDCFTAALTTMIERGDAREAFSVEYFFTNSGEFSGIEANSDKNDLGNPDEAFPAIIIRTKEPNNDRP